MILYLIIGCTGSYALGWLAVDWSIARRGWRHENAKTVGALAVNPKPGSNSVQQLAPANPATSSINVDDFVSALNTVVEKTAVDLVDVLTGTNVHDRLDMVRRYINSLDDQAMM
jgi:hypothetical protein